MKKLTKLVSIAGLVLSGLAASHTANADVSYNVGYVSEYYYRGFFQKSSSASAGLDFEQGGFYAGAWTADVGDGLEVDGYFGYGIETEGGLSLGVGFTGYYYTGEFDDTYEEINLSAGYGPVSVGYSIGEYAGFGSPSDYDFFEIGLDLGAGFYGTYGTFGQDAEGAYFEFGYGTTVAEIDLGVSLVLPDDTIGGGEGLVLSIGKGF